MGERTIALTVNATMMMMTIITRGTQLVLCNDNENDGTNDECSDDNCNDNNNDSDDSKSHLHCHDICEQSSYLLSQHFS